ncbi:MAG TPA: hypothetical protein VK324_09200 [Tepidisphaeraceae bacterium]|nr:hypothetical protein [Tepidisphaeraceae bacterium]
MLTGFFVGVALAASLALLLNVLARRWKQAAISMVLVALCGSVALWQMTRSIEAATSPATQPAPATAPAAR